MRRSGFKEAGPWGPAFFRAEGKGGGVEERVPKGPGKGEQDDGEDRKGGHEGKGGRERRAGWEGKAGWEGRKGGQGGKE